MAVDKLVRRSGLTHAIAVQATGIETTGAVGGSVTGFKPGEQVTGGTSSETGNFVAYDSAGDKLMLDSVSGTFSNGEVITGDESGATITTGTVSAVTEYSSYITIGRLKSQFGLSDSRGVITLTDFDTAENSFFDQITNGRTGNIAMQGWVEYDNQGVLAVIGAYRTNSTVKVKRTGTTTDTTAIPQEIFVGFFSNADITDNEDTATEFAATLAVTGTATS